MIDFIKGKIIEKDIDFIIVMVSNIGYKLNISKNTLMKSLEIGETQKFYTYLYVREDILELFGFIDKMENDCFKLLISVSGVGPKAAIAILSELNPDNLYLSISSGDYKALTKCQGIGPKIAQRIVLELKDKMTKITIKNNTDFMQQSNINDVNDDVINALISLGYSKTDINLALSQVDLSLSTSDIIKSVLKIISKKG